ncbi:UNVERIFIED_CONTAM: hypothetical protein FKN15_045960 [Acipenser sinensis]
MHVATVGCIFGVGQDFLWRRCYPYSQPVYTWCQTWENISFKTQARKRAGGPPSVPLGPRLVPCLQGVRTHGGDLPFPRGGGGTGSGEEGGEKEQGAKQERKAVAATTAGGGRG